MKKIFVLLLSFLCCAPLGVAGTVTGQIQTPSTGRGVSNGTLTFTLSQAAVISGTAAMVANANCWTDTSGNVVGLPGDAAVAAPVLSSNLGSGSLAAGTYFVRYTWANGTGESQASAERSFTLTSAGTLVVQAPSGVPQAATSMKVYISASSGSETLQGNVSVNNGVLAGNFSQSAALTAGAAVPTTNTALCQIRFNDELQPSYTGYVVTFTNTSGASIAGFPQKWYLSGGSNGTVNVGTGLPLYSGVVVYPQPIVSNPAASGTQSINGPLNMNGFAILNTVITNPNGAIILPENAPPSGVANSDVLYADSTAHRFKMINNNGGADVVVGANTAETLSNKTLTAPVISAISNGGTLTLPTSTDTLVGRSTTDTLSNKTFDTASGNIFKINGNQVSTVTGSGSVAVLATSPQLTTPNLGASSGNTHTFTNQTAPANPPAGSITIYGDSGSGNLACRNSSGTSCLSASATAPLISTSANPAGTGVVRVASGDTALAFRTNANNGDVGVTKNSSDVMDLTAFNGMKLQTLQITAPNGFFSSCSNGAFIYNDASNPNSMNLCFGDGTGWKLNFSKRSSSVSTSIANLSDLGVFTTSVFQTTNSNPAGAGVFRCANNQQCLFGRNAASNADVEIASVINDNSVRLNDAINTPSNVVQVPHVKYTGGVINSGAGMMHVRVTSCATPATLNSSCNTTISWPGTWADTNYTVSCTADTTGAGQGLIIGGLSSKTTTQVTVGIANCCGNNTSAVATINCIGMHD